MLKALLFDLDNTLILFDETRFFRSYISKISPVFSDLMSPDLFQKNLLHASKALLTKDGTRSNVDYFMDIFSGELINRRGELWDRYVKFYQTEFDQFRSLVTRIPDIHEIFHQLKKQGLKMVIASNPMWPMDIQKKRLSWAGLEDIPFDFITAIENMAYCKPRLEYYQDICDQIGVHPRYSLMVGNDPVNDMIAANLGIKTYLTTDAREMGLASLAMSSKLRKNMTIEIPDPNFQGSLTGVVKVVDSLTKEGK